MAPRHVYVVAALLVAAIAVAAALWSGGDDSGLWVLDLRPGEDLLDEPIPYTVDGRPVYMIVTSSRVLVVDARSGEVLGEEPLSGVNAGLGHLSSRPEAYLARIEGGLGSVYRVYLDGFQPRVEGPMVSGIEPWSSFSERGLWRAYKNGTLEFYGLPGLDPVVVEPPARFSDPVSLSAHSIGPYDTVSLVLVNASSFTIVFDMTGQPRPVTVLRGYIVADVIESERGLFLLAVSYSGDNIAEYSISYIMDVLHLMEDGKVRTFYGLTHRNAVNYPPAVEFYGDPLYLVFLSVGPKSRTGNFTGTDPALVVTERDGDTLIAQYLADLVGELPPKTLWTPYTGLANPVDLDGDGLIDVVASLKLYGEGDEWHIRIVHVEMEPVGPRRG